MSERTERSEGHERMPGQHGMSERTDRSEGHERMAGQHGMRERTERSEGHERMPGQHGTSTPVTVLSVTGWCRNGSTIIGNVLGEVPGVAHVGELHFLWKNSTGRGVNDRCGCGEALTACPLWSAVLPVGRPAGVSADAHAAEVIRRQRARLRTRHTWRVLRRGASDADSRAHADLLGAVYREVAARTGARVIVDSTKIPGESALLPHVPGVEPYWLHLVRDPRAVAHSWREPKEYVYAMSAARSTAYWHGFNLASAAIDRRYPDRSMLLRYEDFAADPAGTVDALLRLVGADPAGNPVHDRTVELRGNHTVTGNPDRFRTGPTVIRDTDDGWRRTLTGRQRLAVAALAWPLSTRYGYRPGGTARTHPGAAARVGETER